MRAAVVTCTTARATAAVANQAFAAIVEENTVVTRSVYVSLTSASVTPAAYDLVDERGLD